jgi:hypothetical protein
LRTDENDPSSKGAEHVTVAVETLRDEGEYMADESRQEQIKFMGPTDAKQKLVRAAATLGFAGDEEIRGYGPLLLAWVNDPEGLEAYVATRLKRLGTSDTDIKFLIRKLRKD